LSASAPDGVRLPLAVDMDGTLLETDVLAEGMRKVWRERPVGFLDALLRLAMGGRPPFKRRIATLAQLNIDALPVRRGFLAWLQAEKADGRALWLATAADRITAEKVAARFGVFDGVLASDGAVNLKSRAKARALAAQFPAGFVYAGDSAADIAVWRASKGMIMVGVRESVARKVRALAAPVERIFP
jgi:phosphoserine phosphatase